MQLLANTADPDGRVREIEAIEKRADSVVDEIRAALRRSCFHRTAAWSCTNCPNSIDDILDVTEDAAQSLLLYHVTAVTPEAQRLAELALTAASRLQQAVAQLPRLDHPRAILALCAEVDDLEAQADHVQRTAMSNLFRSETEAAQLGQDEGYLRSARGADRPVQGRASDRRRSYWRHGMSGSRRAGIRDHPLCRHAGHTPEASPICQRIASCRRRVAGDVLAPVGQLLEHFVDSLHLDQLRRFGFAAK